MTNETDPGAVDDYPSLELCVQFSEDGQHIRKWSRIPFDDGTCFYSHPASQSQPAATVQEVGREAHRIVSQIAISEFPGKTYSDRLANAQTVLAALTAEPAAKAGDAVATVRTIETVTGDFMTEPGEPFYRIELNGYCADFDHEEAAKNFAAQINALALPSPQPDMGSGEAIGLIGEASFAEVVDCDFWSLQLHFGKGDDARDKMRAVSDALRSAAARTGSDQGG